MLPRKKITLVRLKTQAIVQMKTGYTKQTYKILHKSYTRKTGITENEWKKIMGPINKHLIGSELY